MIETLARMPVEVDYGSEFRYRDPIIGPNTAVLAITQSGETVDTLAAMEEARDKGARLWSIVNVIGSQAHRLSDGFILMQAGPEIGVASTKAFTASLVDQYLLARVSGPTARDARRGAAQGAGGRPGAPARSDGAGVGATVTRTRAPRSMKSWRISITTASISSTWGAASIIRSRSKARSSSKRSATSTPKAIRPAR